MQRLGFKTAIISVEEPPIVAYRKNGSIMKLQKRSKDQWQWVNLTKPDQYVSKINTEGWLSSDFTTPALAVSSMINQFPELEIYFFDNVREFINWFSDEYKNISDAQDSKR